MVKDLNLHLEWTEQSRMEIQKPSLQGRLMHFLLVQLRRSHATLSEV